MRYVIKMLVGLLVILPVMAVFVLPLQPLPVVLLEAQKNARQAFLDGDEVTEITALKTGLSFTPWMGETWQRLGRLQLDLQLYQDSAFSLAQANAQGKLSIEGYLWMADALISIGEKEQAKEQLRQLINHQVKDVFILLQAAQMQRSLNDTYGTLATLLKAYELDPHNAEVVYHTGLQLSAVDPEKALVFLEQASRLDDTKNGTCDSIIHMIKASAELKGTAPRFIYIGQELSNLEEWDVAQRAFQQAVEVDPENGVAWALLAESAQQNGEDASVFITKAQQLAPDTEIVNGLSALYYRRQGKTELALSYLENAIQANPQVSVWEIEMGNTLSEMGDFTAAIKHYQNAVKINLMDWTPWRAMAVFSITYNYDLEAIGVPTARQALALNEGSPALMDLLGTALLLSGKLDEAETWFLQADRIDPDQSAILIHLGQLYLAKGETDTAAKYLEQAKQMAKDRRLSEMAEKLLIENGAVD